MRLDADMQRVIQEQSLGFVATVCPDGTANVSPKGTLTVWDDEHLVFLHIYSPGTVANLGVNPSIEINVVDPIVRKGYRFKGEGEVVSDDALRAAILERYHRERGTNVERVEAVVLVRVDAATPLVSPAYDGDADEAAIVRRWRDHHLDLASERLGEEEAPRS